jgi:hypothetical protein
MKAAFRESKLKYWNTIARVLINGKEGPEVMALQERRSPESR